MPAARYLIITHVAAHATPDPRAVAFDPKYLAALQAQTAALKAAGFDVALAAPFRTAAAPATFIPADLPDLGVELVALPAWRSMPQYLASRAKLRRAVAAAAAKAAVVQVGIGGHPVAMAHALWPTLAASGGKRLFLFGEDPFPARAKHAASGRNPAKRYGKSLAFQRLGRFSQTAIAEAAAVIAHAPSVADRFAAEWKPHCHVLPPGLIADYDLGTPRTRAPAKILRLAAFGQEKATGGADHLIAAFAKARKLSAPVELDLLGDVSSSAPLMDLIRQHKLERVVRLHGKLSDPAAHAVLDACDVFVSTGLLRDADVTIYRAAARGLPIVSYGGDAADSARAAGAATVVPRGETTLLAEALLALSADRDALRRQAEAAHTWAKAATLEAVHARRAAIAWELCK